MDMQGNVQAEHGRFEQIVSQFLLKTLHIILDSRVPSIRSSSRASDLLSSTPVKKSDKWFSLVLGDRPASLDNLSYWHRNLMEPMIIDIILAQEVPDSSSEDIMGTALGLGNHVETVMERWVVQYEYIRTVFPQAGESPASYKKTYKKSIILLRSLYATMRLLPAYKAFRLCSSTETSGFDINYKVSSFSAPLARADEEAMKQYNFLPIDAPQGRLLISVTYRQDLSNFNLEFSPSVPPQIITDYVGSPATDPFRAFPTSKKGENSTSFPLRGIHAPPSYPFQRPHSWSSGIHRASPSMQPVGGSPPIHRTFNMSGDSSSPPTDVSGHRIPNYRLRSHHRTSFDEHQLSPPFSPSPSPSPPTYLSGGNPVQHRLGFETAPVSIPHPMVGRSPRYLSPNLSDPNRQLLPPLSPRSTRHDPSSHESSPGRLSRKLDPSRAGEFGTGMVNPSLKVMRDSRDDSGRFSAVLSSSGSPRVGFSRSSSRLSFQDELDVVDFSCPFIVDDVDTSDSTGSHTLDGRRGGQEFTSQTFSSGRKSQDAAVGALVQMLRTAPPLRQDSSCFSSASSKTEHGGESSTASGYYRKASDALEELNAFRQMKDMLLSKSAAPPPAGNKEEEEA